MALPDSCSPERIQELRTAFNDPNYMPAYCLDSSTTTTTSPNPYTVPTAQPQPAAAASTFPVGIIVAGLVLLFLSME
jgi:hypothetical protein